jgi:hypothetical protein
MKTPWLKRRSALSHDWLKNQYMSALGKFLNLLDDEIEDPEFERLFVPGTLPEWESRVTEVVVLIADFERCMSPRALLDVPPLSACGEDVRRWLGQLVHGLWLGRCAVRESVASALDAAAAADAAYRRLRRALPAGASCESAEELRPLRTQFADFRKRCQLLGAALEQLLPDGDRVA